MLPDPEAPARRLCAACGWRPPAETRPPPGPTVPLCREKTCGQPSPPPWKTCPDCRRKIRAGKQAFRAQRQAQGLCRNRHCGNPRPPEGGSQCLPCREKSQADRRELYRQRREREICVSCGKRPASEGGYADCAYCREDRQDYKKRQRAAAKKRRPTGRPRKENPAA